VLYYGSMKKLILTLTVSSFSFLSFNSAKAYQDLNVTLHGVTYNLISPTNNWWLPSAAAELADLNTPGYDLNSLAGWAQVRGGTIPENAPLPTIGNSGTFMQIGGVISTSESNTNAFVAQIYATNGNRYSLRYVRTNEVSGILDGLVLVAAKQRVNGVVTDMLTNGTSMVFPSTLNMRDHIANENVKNFLEWGLSDIETFGIPANLFSSAPTYYSAPTTPIAPTGASGGAFVGQAKDLNIGLTFTNGQWNPAQ